MCTDRHEDNDRDACDDAGDDTEDATDDDTDGGGRGNLFTIKVPRGQNKESDVQLRNSSLRCKIACGEYKTTTLVRFLGGA